MHAIFWSYKVKYIIKAISPVSFHSFNEATRIFQSYISDLHYTKLYDVNYNNIT